MSTNDTPGRVCREVQAQLPAYEAGSLKRWRRRLIDLHLRRCADCSWELTRQQELAAGLEMITITEMEPPPPPPDDLLDTLLAQAEHPDLRARAAVPARGAVSGARPGLSAALLLAGAATGTAIGYAGWRTARAVSRAVRSHRTR